MLLKVILENKYDILDKSLLLCSYPVAVIDNSSSGAPPPARDYFYRAFEFLICSRESNKFLRIIEVLPFPLVDGVR